MLKWLILIGIAYFIYRYGHVFKAIDRKRESQREIEDKNTTKVDESDYIDYEEVE